MHFEVKKTSNSEFMFNLVDANGQVVASSETYTRKQSALDTIESMKAKVGAARVDDRTVPPGTS